MVDVNGGAIIVRKRIELTNYVSTRYAMYHLEKQQFLNVILPLGGITNGSYF